MMHLKFKCGGIVAKPRAFKADNLRSKKYNQIGVSYTAFGPALTQVINILTFKNTSNGTVYLSEDGSNDHYEFPPGSSETLDLQGNVKTNAQGYKPIGLQFYIRYDAELQPSSGKFILQGQYL